MRSTLMTRNRYYYIFTILFIIINLMGCKDKIPEFAGIYILQNGKYIEVPRYKKVIKKEFNRIQRSGFWQGIDCNVKYIINKNNFVPVKKEIFNKKGFLVVMSREWSDVKLYKIPKNKRVNNNEADNEIITRIDYGCGMMGMPISTSGLLDKMVPDEIELKQGKKGENAFIYVPVKNIQEGYYLINS